MNSQVQTNLFRATLATALAALLAPLTLSVPAAAAAPDTRLAEVVLYGIDGDTNELLRYTFETDEYVRIGTVSTADGKKIDNTEAMTFVPTGPGKGMYCIPRDGSLSQWLLRVNPIDGSATRVADTGLDDSTGMVTVWDTMANGWRILVSGKSKKLHSVDPATGATVFLRKLDETYEGLAVRPDGMLLGNTRKKLFVIDPVTWDETELGKLPYDKVEALEYAFGDFALAVTIPGVDPTWTKDGALFGFDDDSDTLCVINPATGQAKAVPSSFATVDCEGLVMTTLLRDSYGEIVTKPFD